MPGTDEKAVDACWHIGITGREEELLAYGTHPDYHDVTTTHTIGRTDGPVVISLWNAAGQIVFQAPAAALAYMRRADVTRKVDQNATPNQVRDLRAELAAAGRAQS